MRRTTSVRPERQRTTLSPPKRARNSRRTAGTATSSLPPITRVAGLERILAITRELIAQSGIDRLNMRDLAASVGTSLRTLYAQVGSKDHLLLMVIADTFETLNQRIQHRARREVDESLRIVRLARSVQEISLAASSYVRTMLGIYYKNDGFSEVSKTVYDMTYERMSACVDELVNTTAMLPKDIALVKEETTDRLLSVMMKWTQKRIANHDLAHRLIYSTLICVFPYVDPKHSHSVSQAIEHALMAIRRHSSNS